MISLVSRPRKGAADARKRLVGNDQVEDAFDRRQQTSDRSDVMLAVSVLELLQLPAQRIEVLRRRDDEPGLKSRSASR